MADAGSERVEVAIVGAGLVGGTLACALASHGVKCALVDRVLPAAMTDERFDGRASAVAASGQRLFPGEEWDPVTYAILNGRRNPAAMDALRRISPRLADLVGEATEVDPGRRPFNGSALLTRLPAGTRWPTPSRALGAWIPTSQTLAR